MNINKLREERKKKGYSQEEFANLIGVSRQAVSKWESGQSLPEVDKLILISNKLDVSIDYLMDNEYMEEQNVKVKFDYEDFLNQEKKFNTYEYKSKTELFGMPLIHINFSKGRIMFRRSIILRDLQTAKGIIAIGDRAIGIMTVGLFSIGFISLGLFSLGLVTLGVFSLGLLSYGTIAIGYSSIGIIAIGWHALGVVALAKDVAVGVVAVADNAIGVASSGASLDVMLGKNNEIQSLCTMNDEAIKGVQGLLVDKNLPFMIKVVLKSMLKC